MSDLTPSTRTRSARSRSERRRCSIAARLGPSPASSRTAGGRTCAQARSSTSCRFWSTRRATHSATGMSDGQPQLLAGNGSLGQRDRADGVRDHHGLPGPHAGSVQAGANGLADGHHGVGGARQQPGRMPVVLCRHPVKDRDHGGAVAQRTQGQPRRSGDADVVRDDDVRVGRLNGSPRGSERPGESVRATTRQRYPVRPGPTGADQLVLTPATGTGHLADPAHVGAPLDQLDHQRLCASGAHLPDGVQHAHQPDTAIPRGSARVRSSTAAATASAAHRGM